MSQMERKWLMRGHGVRGRGRRSAAWCLILGLTLRNILLLDKFAYVASRFSCSKEHGVACSVAL